MYVYILMLVKIIVNETGDQMSDFSDSELQEFKVEAFDLLDSAEQNLLEIDKGGSFSKNYDAIFRAFHSIKGAAGMLGLTSLQNHMHQLENHFQASKSLVNLSKNQTSYFLKGVDTSRDILNGGSVQFDYNFPTQDESPVLAQSVPTNKTDEVVVAPQIHAASATEKKEISSSANIGISNKKMEIRNKPLVFSIDDEADIVEILADILKDAEFEVKGYTVPSEAIQAVKEHKPDVIFTDMKMPKMSGLDILREVNKIDPEIPVIFVSGHLTKEMIIEALSFGIFGVVEKPFQEAQIVAMASSAAERGYLNKLLNKSINFIMYQFSDLDKYLQSTGQEQIRKMMNEDLKNILEVRRQIKKLKIKQP